jgi:SNF2 family DNA or RNA helicase
MPTIIDSCPFNHAPLDHQLEKWRKCRDVPAWGHLWDPGVGKTFETIAQAAWLFGRGDIDALLVLAPNGVHRNWVTEELPKHWPSQYGKPAAVWYRAPKSDTRWQQEAMAELVGAKGFAALTMSYDALLQEDVKINKKKVPGGRGWAKEFLTKRRVMIVADESGRIKTPDTKRTILAIKASAYAKYRRILDGTPVTQGPFDIYSQIKFLDPEFWIRKGISSFQGFKNQFGVWGSGYCWRPNKKTGVMEKCEFPELKGYKNLEVLQKWLEEITDRIVKEDVLDLPPKVYQRMTFEMTPAQRRVYDQLRDDCMTFLDSGELVTTPIVLTKMLRLQQVCNGYVPVDDVAGDPIRDVGDENPRLDLLGEIVEGLPHKAIIWTRFRRDVDLILEMLEKMGRKAVRYDGAVDDAGRKAAAEAFQKGDAQFFVSNPAAGGEGLTLLGDQTSESLSCQTVIYYSNGFNLRHRLQSEDRAHRIGQRWSVNYIDLVAADTIDQHVVDNLVEKFNIAAQVTGDRLKKWLT